MTQPERSRFEVAFLDDSDDLRTLLSRFVSRQLGVECLTLGSYGDLLSHCDEVMLTKLVFLDINLGENQPSGIDAYGWLRDRGYRGRIYFLTGHARHHPLVAEACESEAVVLEKPIRPPELLSLVRGALGPGG